MIFHDPEILWYRNVIPRSISKDRSKHLFDPRYVWLKLGHFQSVLFLLAIHAVKFDLQFPLGLLSFDPHRGSVASVLESSPPLLDVCHILATETFCFENSVQFFHIERYKLFIWDIFWGWGTFKMMWRLAKCAVDTWRGLAEVLKCLEWLREVMMLLLLLMIAVGHWFSYLWAVGVWLVIEEISGRHLVLVVGLT